MNLYPTKWWGHLIVIFFASIGAFVVGGAIGGMVGH